MFVFKKVSSAEPAIAYLVDTLKAHLSKGEKVLWLLPGGSAIAAAVEVARRLQGTELANLTVGLTDERYGEPGHADSNWQQLLAAGLELPGARLLPVLRGLNAQETAAVWQAVLTDALKTTDYRLGFLGMGPDGHTAGILPHSPATQTREFVAVYEGGPYQRITATAPALTCLDEAVVLATGEAKRQAFENLQTVKSLQEQPAQLLKHIPNSIIFNDLTGEIV
jgi:6-phosphogluconolactonase/glucosamine-6-phosphate isomerase/deaminase